MESLESDTDEERASLLSILSKVQQNFIFIFYLDCFNCVLLLART